MGKMIWKWGLIKYIFTLFLGMIAVVLCIALTEGGPKRENGTDSESTGSPQTSSFMTSDADETTTGQTTSKPTATEPATTKPTTTKPTGTEQASSSDEETVSGRIPLGDGISVIESVWQEVPGYEWKSTFILLLDLTRTSPKSIGCDPVFFAFRLKGYDTPFILTGPKGSTAASTELYLYTMEGEKLYQLACFHEVPQYSPSLGALVFEGESAAYTYSPHVLIRKELKELPEDLSPVAMVSLQALYITSETIESYLVDLSGEEGVR